MNDSMNSFAALLAQHRAAYVQALPARLAQLDSLAGGLDEPALRASTLSALERLAHSLAGSAGTFGLHALGDAARALELAIDEVLEGAGEGAHLPAGAAFLRGEMQRAMGPARAEALQ